MSNIEWTEKTWNPVVGCTPVSPGCDLCYAGVLSHRLAAMGQGEYVGLTVKRKAPSRAGGRMRSTFNGNVRCLPDRLEIPFNRKKPTMYFVNSMADLFHEAVPFYFIDMVFSVMALCPQHTFQVLTKRPERMAEYLAQDHPKCKHRVYADAWLRRGRNAARELVWPLPNVWLGASVEDQPRLDERYPHLARCPAAVRFLSCEPLLGEIDLARPNGRIGDNGEFVLAQAYGDPRMLWACPKCQGTGYFQTDPQAFGCRECRGTGIGIDWVICGGESGPGARPCNVAWTRSIVKQCNAAGVPCFVKQLGARPEQTVRMSVPRFSGRAGVGEYTEDIQLNDPKGGEMSEWPEDLRVREMPEVTRCRTA